MHLYRTTLTYHDTKLFYDNTVTLLIAAENKQKLVANIKDIYMASLNPDDDYISDGTVNILAVENINRLVLENNEVRQWVIPLIHGYHFDFIGTIKEVIYEMAKPEGKYSSIRYAACNEMILYYIADSNNKPKDTFYTGKNQFSL